MEFSEKQINHKYIIYTFVFGMIWGLAEIFLSYLLGNSNLYFKGLIFSAAAVITLLTAKEFAGYNFSLILTAFIALIIKSSAAGIVINLIIAIFAQAVIAEAFLFFKRNKLTYLLAGGGIFLYSFIHSLIFHGSLPNNYIVYLYNNLFSALTGISAGKDMYPLVLIFFGVLSFLIGLFIGWLSYKFITLYQKRLERMIESFS
jgi:hypothetical protein